MTAADKLRELLATRPAMPNTEELVRWWRATARLVPGVLEDLEALDCDLVAARAALRREQDERASLRVEADQLRAALNETLGLVRVASPVTRWSDTLENVMRRRFAREALQWKANHDQRKAELEHDRKALAERDVEVVKLHVELDLLTPSGELFEQGRWRPCSGCHEFDEGHATGPYTETLRCNLGSGCDECGGIGAVWEYHGELKCCPRFSWGDGTHDPGCEALQHPLEVQRAQDRALGKAIAATYTEQPPPAVDDPTRCAVCGWPLAERADRGCVRGNCSQRPRPENLYAPKRAVKEADRG